jgi:RNA polymerase sigma-70 factor, ECF subfamily
VEADFDTYVSSGPDPEALVEAKQRRARLERALDELPEEQRAVFVLFEVEGMSRREIAELLELPAGTVASRLRRAREHFEQRLGLARTPLTSEETP